MQFLKETIVNAAVVGLLILMILQLHSPYAKSVARGPTSVGISSTQAQEANVATAFERHPPAWTLWQPDRDVAQSRTTIVRTTIKSRPVVANVDVPPLPTRSPSAPVTQQDATRWVHVASRQVNVRTAPRLTADRMTSYPQGKRLELVGRLGGWARVRDPETGKDGWMAARYVTGIGAGPGASAPGT